MRNFNLTQNQLNILYVRQGSLIITYWFELANSLSSNQNVIDNVFDSGI